MNGGNFIREKDLIQMTYSFDILISSGIHINQAVGIIENQSKNKRLSKITGSIRKNLEQGYKFSEAISRSCKLPYLFLNMIEIGENTGDYDDVFKKLNSYYSSQNEIKKNIKLKSIYPIIIFAALITLGVVFMKVLEPMYCSLIDQFGGKMPLCTRILIQIYDFINTNISLIVSISLIFIIAFSMIIRLDTIKKALFIVLMHIPVINKFTYLVNAYRIFGTLNMLISSGIGIISSIEIIKNNTKNLVIRDKLNEVQGSIIKGRTLTESIKLLKIDYQAAYLIDIGETTGRIEENIKRLEQIYFKELHYKLRSIEKIMEPAMTIIMAIFVGFFVVAFMQPAYSLITNIK